MLSAANNYSKFRLSDFQYLSPELRNALRANLSDIHSSLKSQDYYSSEAKDEFKSWLKENFLALVHRLIKKLGEVSEDDINKLAIFFQKHIISNSASSDDGQKSRYLTKIGEFRLSLALNIFKTYGLVKNVYHSYLYGLKESVLKGKKGITDFLEDTLGIDLLLEIEDPNQQGFIPIDVKNKHKGGAKKSIRFTEDEFQLFSDLYRTKISNEKLDYSIVGDNYNLNIWKSIPSVRANSHDVLELVGRLFGRFVSPYMLSDYSEFSEKLIDPSFRSMSKVEKIIELIDKGYYRVSSKVISDRPYQPDHQFGLCEQH